MDVTSATYWPARGEAPPPDRAGPAPEPGAAKEEGEGFSFWDLLDVVNPLQHIPVVSVLYRHLTGDEIEAPARLAGGFLFGGPMGLAGSALDVGIEEMTGSDIGGHVMDFIDESGPDTGTAEAAGLHGRASRAYAGGAGGLGQGGALDIFDIEAP